ncbi:hypothetical protein JZ751_001019 [Albula glossodonta]|uniref:Uncharacterized protein n=1 Tax=Albula glossodonta TaxID=121402 RepID=A0A8T2PSI2_9TELE|nr:hypothetical protein JZ751_001019 [Albula glossodonta]
MRRPHYFRATFCCGSPACSAVCEARASLGVWLGALRGAVAKTVIMKGLGAVDTVAAKKGGLMVGLHNQ